MAKLSDTNKFKALDEKQQLGKTHKSVVRKVSNAKSKMISAKVNPDKYAQFTKINKKRGVANNSILNLLITDYINANMHELNDVEDNE